MLTSIPAIFTNPRSWPPVLVAASVYATLISLLGLWGVPYLTQIYALGRVATANTLAWLAIGMVIGSPLIGWLSDRRLGRRKLPFVVSTALYAACWLILITPGAARLPATLLAPLFLFMGLTASGLILVWACVREVNNPAHVGIVIGFCNTPIFLASQCSSGSPAWSSTRTGQVSRPGACGFTRKWAIGGHSAYVWR